MSHDRARARGARLRNRTPAGGLPRGRRHARERTTRGALPPSGGDTRAALPGLRRRAGRSGAGGLDRTAERHRALRRRPWRRVRGVRSADRLRGNEALYPRPGRDGAPAAASAGGHGTLAGGARAAHTAPGADPERRGAGVRAGHHAGRAVGPGGGSAPDLHRWGGCPGPRRTPARHRRRTPRARRCLQVTRRPGTRDRLPALRRGPRPQGGGPPAGHVGERPGPAQPCSSGQAEARTRGRRRAPGGSHRPRAGRRTGEGPARHPAAPPERSPERAQAKKAGGHSGRLLLRMPRSSTTTSPTPPSSRA